jgi:hypothetical protein
MPRKAVSILKSTVKSTWIVALVLAAIVAAAAKPAVADDRGSIVIVLKDGQRQNFEVMDIARIDFKTPMVLVFKDGHQQTISSSDIARIEFEASGIPAATRSHFIGKWEVGISNDNSGTFFITLDADGDAHKTMGASHGTWTVVDGEARITWDDGWHDAIRKVGSKHEKFAYAPGKTFDDKPANVTSARNTQPRPI